MLYKPLSMEPMSYICSLSSLWSFHQIKLIFPWTKDWNRKERKNKCIENHNLPTIWQLSEFSSMMSSWQGYSKGRNSKMWVTGNCLIRVCMVIIKGQRREKWSWGLLKLSTSFQKFEQPPVCVSLSIVKHYGDHKRHKYTSKGPKKVTRSRQSLLFFAHGRSLWGEDCSHLGSDFGLCGHTGAFPVWDCKYLLLKCRCVYL